MTSSNIHQSVHVAIRTSLALLLSATFACGRGDASRADSVADSATGSVSGSVPVTTSGRGAPAAQPSPPAVSASGPVLEWKVRADGVRGAIFGRTSAATRLALGLPSVPAFPKGSCEYMDASKLPVKIGFMFVSDTLARVDVRDSTVATVEGARIGDTEARINELYAGRVTTTPHKYTGPTGHYLTVPMSSVPEHLLVFETDGRRVTTYRMGRKPEVEWVEGCA
jgi:hypothetical protein